MTHGEESILHFRFPFISHIQYEQIPSIRHERHNTSEDQNGDEDRCERVESIPAVSIDEQRRDNYSH